MRKTANKIILPHLRMTPDQLDDLAELIARTMGKTGRGMFKLLLEVSDPEKQPPLFTPLVEVKPSQHGLGVFATQPIAKGTYVTLYPAHLVIDMRETPPIVYGKYKEDMDYALKYRDEILIQGDKQTYGGLCFGHMLNDPCTFVMEFDKATKQTINRLKKRYRDETALRANCEYKKSKYFMWIRATKDIKQGEELLVPYGPHYWMRGVTHLIPK